MLRKDRKWEPISVGFFWEGGGDLDGRFFLAAFLLEELY